MSEPTKETFKTIKWFNSASEEINANIEGYRQGDMEAAEKIIKRFQPLIRKYKALLRGGNISTVGDVGRFLSFFGKDKRQVAEMLSRSLSIYSEPEIDSLLNYCILLTSHKYLKISAGFKYVLKGEIVKLTKDAATHRSTIQLDTNNDIQTLGLMLENPETFKEKVSEVTYDKEFIEYGSSVLGFNLLTKEERIIAFYLFLQGMHLEEVAEILNMSLNSLRAHKQMIIKKIKEGNFGK